MGELIIIIMVLLTAYSIRFMKDHIIILIGNKRVSAKAIEWADQIRLIPYAFIVICPHCREEQWFRKSTLYIAHDNTQNNLRCRYCRKGKQPKRMWGSRDYGSHPNFHPKNYGWKNLKDPPEQSEI